MRKYFIIIMLLLSLCGLTVSCDHKATGTVVSSSEEVKEDKDAPYVEGNKNIMRRENEEMQMFIARYGWQMQRTPTGLYIEILDPGKGDLYKEGDPVNLEYRTFLLTGEMIYSSDSLGLKHFVVNRSEEIDALHEAVQMLRPGARARLVIPSYLAYGVAGDGDLIRGMQPVMMDIHVMEEGQSSQKPYLANPYNISK